MQSSAKAFPSDVLIQPNKSPLDFKRSLQKALSASYSGMLFDEHYLSDGPQLEQYFDDCLSVGISPVLQVWIESFKARLKDLLRLQKKYEKQLFFNLLFEQPDSKVLQQAERLFPSRVFFTCLLTKRNHKMDFAKELEASILQKTDFYFPTKLRLSDPFLTPRQVYAFVKRQSVFRHCQVEPYDRRIAQDMDLEPLTLPFLESGTRKKTEEGSQHLPLSFSLSFSIIIPCYNNEEELIANLESLVAQDYSKDRYEIIVVDDGSLNPPRSALRALAKQQPGLRLKALCFPSVVEKGHSEARFRAAVARNLGSKQAQGEILAFLDSDILCPPNYLSQLAQDHQKADMVMLKRYHLKRGAPSPSSVDFDRSRLKGKYYIEEKRYWGPFYKKGFDGVKAPWKYVCSYGLSLSKKTFKSLGGFGKNFIYYGFEDVELGYKLFKKGGKLLLSELEVFHQAPLPRPLNGQFKSGQSELARRRLLSKSAKIFFYRHADPEIYEELRGFMGQKRGLRYFF